MILGGFRGQNSEQLKKSRKTCVKPFKTAFFTDKSTERIEIKEDTDWFLARKESDDRVVLCNNEIELVVGKGILKEYFRQWG